MFLFKILFNREGNKVTVKKKGENRDFRVPLIGEKAPSFTADSTSGLINFPSDYGSNWKVILCHPMDFTPVCSTEIIELAALQDEFNKLGASLLIVSTDPLETHKQWKATLERIKYKDYPLRMINFPIVDDADLVIAKLYGMIHRETDNSRDVRGVFIIDPDNKIRAEYFYPQEVGRNMDEIIRTIIALQTTERNNVLTPANWENGHDVLIPFPAKTDMSLMNKESGEYYQVSWFMIFRKGLSDFLDKSKSEINQ
jgi:peroxiredoxin (alkyl hydroperoxide reductase subunit C)